MPPPCHCSPLVHIHVYKTYLSLLLCVITDDWQWMEWMLPMLLQSLGQSISSPVLLLITVIIQVCNLLRVNICHWTALSCFWCMDGRRNSVWSKVNQLQFLVHKLHRVLCTFMHKQVDPESETAVKHYQMTPHSLVPDDPSIPGNEPGLSVWLYMCVVHSLWGRWQTVLVVSQISIQQIYIL